MSFLQKLRAVTLGTAHDLLDKAVDMNSPSILRQYIRDLEDALGKMNSEVAIQNGQLRTMKRERDDLSHVIDTDKATAKSLLASQPDRARSKAELVVVNQKHLDQMDIDIQNQQKTAEDLAGAVEKLQAKHDQMLSRVRELERIDRDSKTKEATAAALSNAGSLANSVSSRSVDDVEDRMRRRNDVASAKFDQAMSSMPDEHPADSAEVDALMADLAK